MISVSIVIPCFNGAATLPMVAENIQPLLCDDTEAVFVDDGSTDGSAEMFRRLVPAARIISQKNSGLAAARNAGAREARGEFLQFLDADDTIDPAKLKTQVPAIRQANWDVVYSDWRMVVVNGDRKTQEPFCRAEAPVELVEALLGGWCVPVHGYLFRREAYWSVGGSDATLVNAQDFDLVLRLAIAGKKFGYCPGGFADYYRYLNSASLARGPRRQYWSDYDKATHKALRLLEEQTALTPSRRRTAASKLHYVARNVYPIDRAWFARLVGEVYELDPDFRPPGSTLYRTTAQLLGLTRAEALAVFLRRFRTAQLGNGRN